MASNFQSDTDGPIAAINVTPLVDVMLVLLVIFMVTAPMLQQGVEVDLPKATSAPLRGSNEQIVISVDKAGTVFLGSGNKVAVGRKRRHVRVRKKVSGTADRPRLVVTRSARHMVAQVVDDTVGRTLASASTMEVDLRGANSDKTAKARKVGQLVAERAKTAGVQAVVFDRGGNRYHGRVAALAEGAREGGLDF